MRKVISVGLGIVTLGAVFVVGVSDWDDEPRFKTHSLTHQQLRTALASRLSVADAVAVAKGRGGGEVLEASYYYLPLRLASVYALKTYRNGVLWEAQIDTNSGQVLGAEETTARSALDPEDKAEVASIQRASVSITRAIEIAENQTKGKVIAVDLEKAASDGVFWEVTVVTGQSTRRLLIDPAPSR